MCSVGDRIRLRMRKGAVTLLSISSQTRCGRRRSQKGGSHGEDRTGIGPRTSGGSARRSAARAGDGGEHGDRHVALEAGVLHTLGWRGAAPAQYTGGIVPSASDRRAVSGVSVACGVRSLRIRLRARLVAAGAAGGGDSDRPQPGGARAGAGGEDRSLGRRTTGPQAREGRAQGDLHTAAPGARPPTARAHVCAVRARTATGADPDSRRVARARPDRTRAERRLAGLPELAGGPGGGSARARVRAGAQAVARAGGPARAPAAPTAGGAGAHRAVSPGGPGVVRPTRRRGGVGHPAGVGAGHHRALCERRGAGALPGADAEPVQLRGTRSSRPHPEMRPRCPARVALAVCLGGGAPGSRCGAARALRAAGTAARAQARHRRRGAALGGAPASALGGGAAADARGVRPVTAPPVSGCPPRTGPTDRLGSLRAASWLVIPHGSPTSQSLAAGHSIRCPTAAPHYNLVHALARACTNSRLARRRGGATHPSSLSTPPRRLARNSAAPPPPACALLQPAPHARRSYATRWVTELQ